MKGRLVQQDIIERIRKMLVMKINEDEWISFKAIARACDVSDSVVANVNLAFHCRARKLLKSK